MQSTKNIRLGGQAEPDEITKMRVSILKLAVESGFSCDKVGAVVDKSGELYMYCIATGGFLTKIVGSPLTHISVHRIYAIERQTLAYIRKSAQQLDVLSDDQKQFCIDNIKQALALSENQKIREMMHEGTVPLVLQPEEV